MHIFHISNHKIVYVIAGKEYFYLLPNLRHIQLYDVIFKIMLYILLLK